MANLRQVTLDAVQTIVDGPTLHIKTEEDVEAWKTTQSYRDYSTFLQRLNESVVNYYLPWSPETPARGTVKILALLDKLDQWTEDIPPLETPQRFGNLAFRSWGRRLEEQCDSLLAELLGDGFEPVIRFAKPYLLTSFGSFTRMDYGTGHETSFALFLLVLTLVRFFEPVPEVERQLVLVVFLRYLRLCWKLQDVYRLEPAGSHGVWGLDDSHFLPYIFGSGELRDQTDIPVNAILQTPLPDTNLYFLSISRIHEVKHGPFHEHSSSLHAIAVGVANWGKVNSGLFKMYEAEVLSKRVVVQHIPLGGILEWNPSQSPASDLESAGSRPGQTTQMPPHPTSTSSSVLQPIGPPRARAPLGHGGPISARTANVGTRAPWVASAAPGSSSRSGNLEGARVSASIPNPPGSITMAPPPGAVPPKSFPNTPADSGRGS
ncbi:hypothetical protein DFP72DRAFT_892596 [Ephemerocybe angulata]|uniref:Serine/threonine-protein phosphatase 2A activator n=1 Tax=Ephemerocybe angulata TaxID=980116 RepID=A0A8H6I2P3_9AGAR|nr:hypothetical protein DFP72DRAFT_892596 [Tulosesus angulatus]